jgi:hypothetical protein
MGQMAVSGRRSRSYGSSLEDLDLANRCLMIHNLCARLLDRGIDPISLIKRRAVTVATLSVDWNFVPECAYELLRHRTFTSLVGLRFALMGTC